jgi:hypothetical protein
MRMRLPVSGLIRLNRIPARSWRALYGATRQATSATGHAKSVWPSGGFQWAPALPNAFGLAGLFCVSEIGIGSAVESTKLLRDRIFEFGKRVLPPWPRASLGQPDLVSCRSEQLGDPTFISAGQCHGVLLCHDRRIRRLGAPGAAAPGLPSSLMAYLLPL